MLSRQYVCHRYFLVRRCLTNAQTVFKWNCISKHLVIYVLLIHTAKNEHLMCILPQTSNRWTTFVGESQLLFTRWSESNSFGSSVSIWRRRFGCVYLSHLHPGRNYSHLVVKFSWTYHWAVNRREVILNRFQNIKRGLTKWSCFQS